MLIKNYMPKFSKTLNFADAINQALTNCLKKDKNLICYGLGINDPKRIFTTTKGLVEKFGTKRIFDVPTSENANTGISIGASLAGVRSVVTHQRLDFFLLSMDQLVNSAAKWYYMFDGKKSVPITIRLIIGRGWGQGPTHSQNLQAWFNHIPGLKVLMPTYADDARDLLEAAIYDPNPVIFLEHRWLHYTSIKLSKRKKAKIGSARICKTGKDITIISMSYLTLEAVKAADFLKKYYNISCEVIDLRSIKPLDWKKVFSSINKTKRVLVLDTGFEDNSVSSEIITKIVDKFYNVLKYKPSRMGMPNYPEPTSYGLTKKFYITYEEIIFKITKIFNKKYNKKYLKNIKKENFHDIPNKLFKGPF